MKVLSILAMIAALAAIPGVANAETAADFSRAGVRDEAGELPAYQQCVPDARALSGIQIYGDAHSWWEQAEGRYKRGHSPQVGAVMAFEATDKMQLGHVAAVSQVIDSRTVLLDHANWSPINGRRGQVERNVRAVDVSPNNDWSQVRVWYHPLQGLGTTAWPVAGFIYNERGTLDQPTVLARASAPQPARISDKPSRKFAEAFTGAFTAQTKARSRRDVVGAIIAGGS